MDAFHNYLKSLTKPERESLAGAAGTSLAYLWQIAYKQRRCNESMAIEIEKASKRAVRVEDLRPDVDWAYVRSSAQSIADSAEPDTVDRMKSTDDVQPPVGTPSRKPRKA